MKTDTQIGMLFKNNPGMLADLLSLQVRDEFCPVSDSLKEIVRNPDFVLGSKDGARFYVIEFQGYYDRWIFHRGEIERILVDKQNPDAETSLILVFLDPSMEPVVEPWTGLVKSGSPFFKVVYLEEAFDELEAKDPDHPVLCTLLPLRVKDDDELKTLAPLAYEKLVNLGLPDDTLEGLLLVLESLILSRFQDMTIEEVRDMLAPIGNLEESVAYQQIKAIGVQEGEAIGVKKGEAIGVKKGEAIGVKKGKALGVQEGEARKALEGAEDTLKTLENTYKAGGMTEEAFLGLSVQYEKIVEQAKAELKKLGLKAD